jgi:hypothetical protein
MNIFIWTDDPPSTFDQVTAAISIHALWAHLRAAFRAEGQDDYTVLTATSDRPAVRRSGP